MAKKKATQEAHEVTQGEPVDNSKQDTKLSTEISGNGQKLSTGTEQGDRKPFSIPVRYRVQLDGKKGLVVSGYTPEPIAGHHPHVSPYRIIGDLGLNPRDYCQCDERHHEIVEAAREAGLEVITVKDYLARLAEKG